jgi:hypothetical protein
MTEADIIIGIYQGFQAAIGCGHTVLWRDEYGWFLEWTSPVCRGHRHGASYRFSSRELFRFEEVHHFDPSQWGAILASEVREKWGGNPDQADKDSKPLIFQDGLGE